MRKRAKIGWWLSRNNINSMKKNFYLYSLSAFLCLFCGCAPILAKLSILKQNVKVPQIVAFLEPRLESNKIIVSGEIAIQNPSESDLDLEKIIVFIKDESDQIIEKETVIWKDKEVSSQGQISTPVEIELSLSVLNKSSIKVDIDTAFTYKTIKVKVPVKNTVAIFKLDSLKKTIAQPFEAIIYTKLYSDVLGRGRLDYKMSIRNPFKIDLELDNARFIIYTKEVGQIASSSIIDTVFKAQENTLIQGEIGLENLFDTILAHKFIWKHPLRFKLTGNLKIPKTDIVIPLSLEAVHDVDFSLINNNP